MPNRRKFFKYAGLGAALAAVGSAVAWRAHAHGRWHGPIDPARLDEMVERGLKHAYIELDATPEQQQRLAPIAKEAARDLLPLREKFQAARKRGLELLTAASVDRGALENLRAEQIQLADAGSRRLAQALADVAEVLTPEQRRHVAQHIERRHRRWHG